MKMNVSAFLMALTSLVAVPALAEELSIDREHVKASTDRVTLIRNSKTPKKVKIDMPILIRSTYCAQQSTQLVFGTHPSCGTETHIEKVPVSRCVKLAKCTLTPTGAKDCKCVKMGTVYEDRIRTRTRSCHHPETVCVRRDISTRHESRRVTLHFKKVEKLRGGETELFELTGHQMGVDSSDYDFNLEVLKANVTYETRSRERAMFNDMIVISR